MKLARFLPLLLSGLLVPLAAQADHGVNLTHDLPHVDVLHDGQPARIERNPGHGKHARPGLP
jgi:hypothetical protein